MNCQVCKGFLNCPPKLWITMWKTRVKTVQYPYTTLVYRPGLKNEQEYFTVKSYSYKTTTFPV